MAHQPGTRGFTLVELLVVTAIIAILAGLLVPAIMGARTRADRTVCLGTLKQLATLAMTYADDHEGQFPLAKGSHPPAYQSLQLIADTYDIKPDLFLCPASQNSAAEKDEDGKYTLDETRCSFAWIGQRTENTAPSSWALGSDDSMRHDGGMNVIYVGMNAEWVPGDQLPESGLPERLVDNGQGGN